MKNYVIYWDDGIETFSYNRECTYEELKDYIRNVIKKGSYTLVKVEELVIIRREVLGISL